MSNIVLLVQIVEAVQRISPDEFEGFTFFSEYDRWLFRSERDGNVCDDCDGFDGIVFRGDELRTLFPALAVSRNMIYPQVHPNCRCELHRDKTIGV